MRETSHLVQRQKREEKGNVLTVKQNFRSTAFLRVEHVSSLVFRESIPAAECHVKLATWFVTTFLYFFFIHHALAIFQSHDKIYSYTPTIFNPIDY
jgi:hypothetical protein